MSQAPNQLPTAAFTHSETFLQTSVNGSASSDPDGTIASYAWSWGDGTADGSGATATHTYAASGTYTVGLTVTDNRGGTDTKTATVTVAAQPGADGVVHGLGELPRPVGQRLGIRGRRRHHRVLRVAVG